MYKNMKIEINSEQPLDEVVKELEHLGYVKDRLYWDYLLNPTLVCACDDGTLIDMREAKLTASYLDKYETITLSQLKQMENWHAKQNIRVRYVVRYNAKQ